MSVSDLTPPATPPAPEAALTKPVVADVAPGPGSWWSKFGTTARTAIIGAVGAVATVGALAVPSMSTPPTGLDTINGCGMEGSAHVGQWQWAANPLKNRYDIPEADNLDPTVTLARMASETDTTATAGNTVLNQDNSATIDGYIYLVKTGGTESCNCGTSTPDYMDTHIYVGPAGATSDKQCVIVEVTPRIRQLMAQQGTVWSTPALMSMLKPGTHVHITGWLFYDAEHWPAAANNPQHGTLVWRASCWELHPVTDIEVLP
jgi:hypothetical protein